MNTQSVVRIFVTTQEPDHETPWQTQPPANATGSGVVISPGHVLTGAHVVADATFLQVQKVSDPNKWVARVEAICHDSDLALLEIDDPRFMKGVRPEKLGDLPELRNRVSVAGYPIGGEEISITEGVVSRIEVQRYTHSERMLLAVTVDAAINEGNSGGPVFNTGGKVVGIAFQTLKDAENIGEMVPTNLIRHFLEGVKKGRLPHIPGLGITTQNLENPELRKRARLGRDRSGVLVVSIEQGGSAAGHLELGDALLSIDGHRIATNGTVQYKNRFRTSFDAVLGDHYVGDTMNLVVARAGKVMEMKIELQPFAALVPRSQYDMPPSYFVYGGIVFQPLSLDYLRTWGRSWWEKAPTEFLHLYYAGHRTPEQQEIVVLNQVLADEVNVGYEHLSNTSVVSVNGVRPRNMHHFVELCEEATTRLELETSDRCLAVFEVKLAREANRRILSRYHIGSDRSVDLRPARAGLARKPRAAPRRRGRRVKSA
jgi:S1-C subfamily serine protease